MKNKVSFDFDQTLDNTEVQEYAKELLNKGFDVWICTSRLEPSKAPTHNWNDDLFLIAEKCGIKRDKIIFTNYEDKSVLLKDNGFIFHLDDDVIALSFIRTDTDIAPVSMYKNKLWREQCDNAIRQL